MNTDANYPLADVPEDPRFTYGLIFDIADTLSMHGFPRPQAADWPALILALHHFIYQRKD